MQTWQAVVGLVLGIMAGVVYLIVYFRNKSKQMEK